MVRRRFPVDPLSPTSGRLAFAGFCTPVIYPRYRLVLFMAGTVADDGFGTALAPATVLRKHKWGIRMNVDEDTVRQLAQLIWETEGKPEGQESRHWEMATRLAESAAMAPVRTSSKHKVDTLFPSPDEADPNA
ncbi:DUF2934 family protein [Pseudomonas graminis]|uniref:DUF2934 domain-containing protein n=1 Tax=Pseudomonas graminis TaxID=158627 RepID=UPI0010EA8190|nr:DUF2934 domain-containing protein [Pseudomonas graminis]TDV56737.1 DUF2934 family protein [Pseudomonas graminis]